MTATKTKNAKKTKARATAKKVTKTAAAKSTTPKKLSALDAAAKVLVETGGPMTTKEMIETMAAKRLWEPQRQDAGGHALRRDPARGDDQG